MLKRIGILGYGVISYFAFFLSFCYFIAFVGNIWVPKGIDAVATLPIWQALLINIGLILLFTIPHSVMARPAFKRWLTQYIPQSIERSTFVLSASILLTTLMVYWQPLGGLVWQVENENVTIALYSIFALGTVIAFLASFLINHFDLFGLRQVWLAFLNKPYTDLKYSIPFLYKVSRHPLYLGLVLVFWATPTMTLTHLTLATLFTTYVVIAIQFEERDLVAHFGDKYREYQKQVPMLLPGFKRNRPTNTKKQINVT